MHLGLRHFHGLLELVAALPVGSKELIINIIYTVYKNDMDKDNITDVYSYPRPSTKVQKWPQIGTSFKQKLVSISVFSLYLSLYKNGNSHKSAMLALMTMQTH